MLGDNIKKYRKESSISQEELAEKLGVTRQSISLWENNQTQPSLENVIALAKIFNVTTDELLSGEAITENTVNDVAPTKNSNKKSVIWILSSAFVIVTIILFLLRPWSNEGIFFTKPFSENTASIAKKEASVVKVFCYDHKGSEIATGSGVILFHDDMVVTNYHVIEDAYSAKISTDQDITYAVAGLWHKNEKNDIAILKLKKSTALTPLKIGESSTVKKGETVIAIGSPLGIKNTVSKGNLSARIMQDGYDVLQFTAPISNGSSGGALFNESGAVIGITYASFVEGQNLNLAIPIELVDNLYQSKSLSVVPESFEDNYWDGRMDEYYDYTYGKPVSVTFSELKRTPEKYCNKMISVEAYVSSIDSMKLSSTMYISHQKVISDYRNDMIADLNSHYHEHNLIKVFSKISDGIKVDGNPKDKVLITGVFHGNESDGYSITLRKSEVL